MLLSRCHEIGPHPVNTAKFLWPVNDLINDVPLFYIYVSGNQKVSIQEQAYGILVKSNK